MINKGAEVQLCRDHKVVLDQGSITFSAGAVGLIETPGENWAAVRFTDTIRALIPTQSLRDITKDEP